MDCEDEIVMQVGVLEGVARGVVVVTEMELVSVLADWRPTVCFLRFFPILGGVPEACVLRCFVGVRENVCVVL